MQNYCKIKPSVLYIFSKGQTIDSVGTFCFFLTLTSSKFSFSIQAKLAKWVECNNIVITQLHSKLKALSALELYFCSISHGDSTDTLLIE